jgi:hypothetical protein
MPWADLVRRLARATHACGSSTTMILQPRALLALSTPKSGRLRFQEPYSPLVGLLLTRRSGDGCAAFRRMSLCMPDVCTARIPSVPVKEPLDLSRDRRVATGASSAHSVVPNERPSG